jgi:hypothetical protein
VERTYNVSDFVARFSLVFDEFRPDCVHGTHFLEVVRSQVQILETLKTTHPLGTTKCYVPFSCLLWKDLFVCLLCVYFQTG